MDNPIEPAKAVETRLPSEAEIFGCKAVRILFLNAQRSSLPTADYWKALVRLSTNDATLRTVLNDSKWEQGKSNPKEAQKPIEI